MKRITILFCAGALAFTLGCSGNKSNTSESTNPSTASDQSAMGSNATSSNNNMQNGSSSMSNADQEFMKKAAQGGMAEVELGQLATEKAASPGVKQFGQRMVDDHSKANDQLKAVAGQTKVTLPADLDPNDQQTKDQLSKLSGKQFDRAYMKDMVKDHTQDIKEFQNEAQNGTAASVKSFASQTLPTLRSHLQEVQKLQKQGK